MSIWTHVAGIIRVDEGTGNFDNISDLKKLFVKDIWGEPKEGKCNMPCGSEESLNYSIWENPDKSSICKYTISIFGDLRDFEEPELPEIKQWWDDIIKKLEYVRQAIILIECEETSEPIIYKYTTKDWMESEDE